MASKFRNSDLLSGIAAEGLDTLVNLVEFVGDFLTLVGDRQANVPVQLLKFAALLGKFRLIENPPAA